MIAAMECFDDHVKADFPKHNTPADIEAGLDTLIRLKMPECDGYGLSPACTTPAALCILLQSGLRRTIELTEGAIREINRRNLVISALLSRGTLETACLLWDVMMQVEDAAQSNDTKRLKSLNEILDKSLFGGKAKEVMMDPNIEARNVLTIIQRLSKKKDVPLEGFARAYPSSRIRIITA
jgi:hypothetical protein